LYNIRDGVLLDKIEVAGDFTYNYIFNGVRRSYTLQFWGSKEEPLFKAVDVAEIIDYSIGNTAHMIEYIEPYEKVLVSPLNLGRTFSTTQKQYNSRYLIWFITESGLYEVLMRSSKPIAKHFKSFIKQTLHDIRKQHNYEWPFFTDNTWEYGWDYETNCYYRSRLNEEGEAIEHYLDTYIHRWVDVNTGEEFEFENGG